MYGASDGIEVISVGRQTGYFRELNTFLSRSVVRAAGFRAYFAFFFTNHINQTVKGAVGDITVQVKPHTLAEGQGFLLPVQVLKITGRSDFGQGVMNDGRKKYLQFAAGLTLEMAGGPRFTAGEDLPFADIRNLG